MRVQQKSGPVISRSRQESPVTRDSPTTDSPSDRVTRRSCEERLSSPRVGRRSPQPLPSLLAYAVLEAATP